MSDETKDVEGILEQMEHKRWQWATLRVEPVVSTQELAEMLTAMRRYRDERDNYEAMARENMEGYRRFRSELEEWKEKHRIVAESYNEAMLGEERAEAELERKDAALREAERGRDEARMAAQTWGVQLNAAQRRIEELEGT